MTISIDILNDDNIKNISFDYWNDENIEKKKKYYDILDNFDDFKENTKQNILSNQFSDIINNKNLNLNNKNILSLGSGACYVEARSLNNIDFNQLTCIDFSKHRITKMAPSVFKKFNMENKSINLVNGTIEQYFKKNKNIKFDLIFMCKSFHHFPTPNYLLRLVKERLNKNGSIIIIGEPYHGFINSINVFIKNIIKYIINYKKFRNDYFFYELLFGVLLKDKKKGDVHWSIQTYKKIFKKNNFMIENLDVKRSEKTVSFHLK